MQQKPVTKMVSKPPPLDWEMFKPCRAVTRNLLDEAGFPAQIFLHMEFDIVVMIIGLVLNIIVLIGHIFKALRHR